MRIKAAALAGLCIPIVVVCWFWCSTTEHSREARSLGQHMGLDVLWSNGPFSVLVKSPNSPDRGFAFAAHRQEFLVHDGPVAQEREGIDLRDVMLTVGEGFSVSCLYQPSTIGNVKEFKLILEDYGLIDFNVDGSWDMKIHYPPNTRVDVLLDNVWREVTLEDGSEYRRKLVEGGYVVFDLGKGNWLRKDGD